MNYIGSKLSLLPFLEQVFREISDGTEQTVCDMFAGTGAVGRHFKKLGLRIVANDLQYYAYVLNKAYLEINHDPAFEKLRQQFDVNSRPADSLFDEPLKAVLDYVNRLSGASGFIAQNYSPDGNRLYYTRENAEKTDAIRQALEIWKSDQTITEQEYFYLLCSLIEAIDQVANTACVYEAFLKKFKKTALKPLTLKPLELVNHVSGCEVHNRDANELIEEVECDILYLDPPYNERQYSSNYHILETIARYDDPLIAGVTGIRKGYARSSYCRKREVIQAFEHLVRQAKTRHILLSYNDEGLMTFDEIHRILGTRGEVRTFQTEYNRFKADNGREYKRNSTVEFVHYVRVTKS